MKRIVNTAGRSALASYSIWALVSFAVAAEEGSNDIGPAREALRRATAAVVHCGQKAAAARDMALNAMDNAFAVRHDAEVEWMNALRDGGKERVSSAARRMKKAVKDAVKAGSTAESVVRYAAEAINAAEIAKETERIAADPDTGYDLEKAVEEVEKLALSAVKAARKAEAVAEPLKKKWLMLPLSTGEDLEPAQK